MFMINPFLSALCQAYPPSSNAASAAAFHAIHVPNGIVPLSPAKSRNDRLHHAPRRYRQRDANLFHCHIYVVFDFPDKSPLRPRGFRG